MIMRKDIVTQILYKIANNLLFNIRGIIKNE